MTARPLVAAAALAACWASAGCRTEETLVTPDPHLERMLVQPKVLAYAEDPLLPGGAAMQNPPDGTLRADAPLSDPLFFTGYTGTRYAAEVPMRVDRAVADLGRARFETYCAPCHGLLGDGQSIVAEKMALRKPPSLHEARIVAYPPGRIFRTIREGYGLMPSYASVLSPADAWSVVTYVRALQLSQDARVSELPSAVRAELLREARQ